MVNRPNLVVFGLVSLLALGLFSLPGPAATRAKLSLGALFLPLFGAAQSADGALDRAEQAVLPRRRLLARLDSLEEENRQLRVELLRAEAAREENRRLRELLGWREVSPWRLKPARVIARDPAGWWQTVRIDVGTRDGVTNNLPVLAPEGLVGRLGQVGTATAEVVLIGDPKCRVAVVVRETGETGMLTTLSPGLVDHRLVDLTHLPRNTTLKPGQTVFTSGLGGVFPAGVPVGTIVDWREVGYGLYTEARVQLLADSSRLQEVMVILP
ncbi:MAG: rod shape-determining protein MreC [Verrucomicrobiales bacterium]|nr:rod shape-determining protein MreC [Verrucomicrobiales bacterium]